MASRFPAGFAPAPPPAACGPVRSPIRHVAPWLRLHRPVGFVVAFLRRARRSRVGAGWGSPRIMSCAWWPVRWQTVASALRSHSRAAKQGHKPEREGRTDRPSRPKHPDARQHCPRVLIEVCAGDQYQSEIARRATTRAVGHPCLVRTVRFGSIAPSPPSLCGYAVPHTFRNAGVGTRAS